jgi:outer membrane protein TolC
VIEDRKRELKILAACCAIGLSGCATPLREANTDIPVYPVSDLALESAPPLQDHESLGLVEAIERALQWNLGDAALEAEKNWIAAGQTIRRAGRAPQIRLGFGENEGRSRSRYGLRIYPPTPWGRNAAADRADYLAGIAETRLAAEEHELAMKIRGDYLKLYQRKRRSDHLAKIVEIRSRRFDEIQELVAEGEGVATDQMRARLDLLGAVTDRDRVEQDRLRVCGEIAAILGFPGTLSDEQIDLSAIAESMNTTIRPLDELIDMAYEQRADIIALPWRRRVAEVDLEAAKRMRIPWLSHIQGSIEDESSSSGSTWGLQAAIDLPFGGETSALVAEECAEKEHYASQMEKVQRRVANEVRLARIAVESSRRNVDQILADQLPLLDAMEVELGDQQIGGTLQADLRADLRRRIIQADMNRINALESYEFALLRLLGVTGNAVP